MLFPRRSRSTLAEECFFFPTAPEVMLLSTACAGGFFACAKKKKNSIFHLGSYAPHCDVAKGTQHLSARSHGRECQRLCCKAFRSCNAGPSCADGRRRVRARADNTKGAFTLGGLRASRHAPDGLDGHKLAAATAPSRALRPLVFVPRLNRCASKGEVWDQ